MQDVLTEIPPPSRFFQEDLNNFTPPSPPLPSPFLLFSQNLNGAAAEMPLRPSLLIVALSSPSLHLFHNVSYKTLIGTLILPETPFSGNSIDPSLKDKSCNIYSLPNPRIPNPPRFLPVPNRRRELPRRGQAAHFSPDRPPEGPDSRLCPDHQLPRQTIEGRGGGVQAGDHRGKKGAVFEAGIFPLGQRRGWAGRGAVGGVRNQEHQGGALRDVAATRSFGAVPHPVPHLPSL